MRLELAVLGGAALIAAAVMATNHWEVAMQSGGVFRLNRWTGEVKMCLPNAKPGTDKSAFTGNFSAVCDDRI
jgi:hypothetical protein